MIQEKPHLRVMSFNILSATSWHSVSPWHSRKEAVAACIRAFEPDLLGAQEVQNDQADYLRRELSGYGVVTAGRNDGLWAGESIALFYRMDRFEALGEGHFWLSKTPDVPGSRDWLTVTPRITSWVKLRGLGGGVPFFFFSTHFDPIWGWARRQSALLLRRQVGAIAGGAPTILTGDFNAHAGRGTYRRLLRGEGHEELEFIDAYRCANPLPMRHEGTFRGLGGPRSRRRIDWILHTTHFQTTDAYIDRMKHNGRYPSDHFPVAATLRW